MWLLLAIFSALGLGFYDVFKKLSVRGNDVLMVLMLNTIFGFLFISPFFVSNLFNGASLVAPSFHNHLLILLKSFIVLGSWILGYFAIKHLPLTVQGPINASRPVIVLAGALLLYGEQLNITQWCGLILGFVSLFFSSRIGGKEVGSKSNMRWIWMSIGATILGAISALYDKFLMRSFTAIDVQGWYTFYQTIIMVIVVNILKRTHHEKHTFKWRWTIPFIALFLTAADMAYFESLTQTGSMIAVVSMIRRGSVLVSFLYGAFILREKNLKIKILDLLILLAGLILLILGSC